MLLEQTALSRLGLTNSFPSICLGGAGGRERWQNESWSFPKESSVPKITCTSWAENIPRLREVQISREIHLGSQGNPSGIPNPLPREGESPAQLWNMGRDSRNSHWAPEKAKFIIPAVSLDGKTSQNSLIRLPGKSIWHLKSPLWKSRELSPALGDGEGQHQIKLGTRKR